MNPLFARFLRTVYRTEPVSGFILILGATDALVGGLDGRQGLLSMGLLIALLGIVMRWRQGEKKDKDRAIANTEPARLMLPPGTANAASTANQPLPLLTKKLTNKKSRK